MIFRAASAPGDAEDRHADPLDQAGVVGGVDRRLRPGACPATSTARRKPCGVCTARSAARSSVAATWPDSSTCLIVSTTGSTGITASWPGPHRRGDPLDQLRRREGARGVVHQHDRVSGPGRRRAPRRPSPAGWPRPSTTTERARRPESRTAARVRTDVGPAGAATTTQPTLGAWPSRRTACTSSDAPPNSRSALGAPGPSRVPRPAAGTRTATSPRTGCCAVTSRSFN